VIQILINFEIDQASRLLLINEFDKSFFFTFEVSLEDFKIYCCGVVNSKIGHSTIFNGKIGHNTIFRFLLQTSSTLFVALRNHELNNWMTLRLQESRDYL